MCFTEDVKRLNEKLAESNKFKMELQLKLDEIQSSEASLKVHTRFHRQSGVQVDVPEAEGLFVCCSTGRTVWSRRRSCLRRKSNG